MRNEILKISEEKPTKTLACLLDVALGNKMELRKTRNQADMSRIQKCQ